ncbi:hypothetical protein ACMBCN_01095, partial [Candidatus Liberibacter asiaticus]|nr:hypothetical protein [Candidatus Liberibacter asiaticus]
MSEESLQRIFETLCKKKKKNSLRFSAEEEKRERRREKEKRKKKREKKERENKRKEREIVCIGFWGCELSVVFKHCNIISHSESELQQLRGVAQLIFGVNHVKILCVLFPYSCYTLFI